MNFNVFDIPAHFSKEGEQSVSGLQNEEELEIRVGGVEWFKENVPEGKEWDVVVKVYIRER